ncbi:TIR domain-containing protein [Priestia megaterium]|uniref:TIR domain-containing protein n=1 Tax=Priestia megaterium TaxID=1404 RepID=UPI001A9448AB|nr:TIR domain-containing protein [Priestia megaterium]QSX23453.1 TIR domain-containing protein [Priestia megaterium]
MVKHKTFISYHHENEQWAKDEIIEKFGKEDFIDVSVHDGDIDVNLPEEKIMKKIRDDYLKDSTVTLVIVGEETSQRPFINSEIQASLWGSNPNGLLAVVTDELYTRIYRTGTCSGGNCNCNVRIPQHHSLYLPELVYKNRDINRNNDLESVPCHYTDSQVYCSLTKFSDFIKNPDLYINEAFDKRSRLNYNIAKKLSKDTPKIQKNSLSTLSLF